MGLGTTLLDKVMTRFVSKGALTVYLPDGSSSVYGPGGEPSAAIRINDPKLPMQLVKNPELIAGEAYMDGRLEMVDCTIRDFLEVFANNRDGLRKGPIRSKVKAWNKKIRRWHQRNPRAASSSNVKAHYDISNELYRMFLDADMQYSCAYWPSRDITLEEAQLAKKRHIAAKLDLKPGQRVLDIGCGWGGMAIYLAQNFDVEVTGITLSEEQLALARTRAEEAGVADRVRFNLVDYRNLAESGAQFDRIVSVGMFEHVGRPQYETFFEACANLLTNEGTMLLHTIGRMGTPGTTDAYTRKYIFPGGYIPALSETVVASEKFRLMATDIEMLRVHYGKTIKAWYANCLKHRDAIVAMYDERFFRMWTFYLAGAATVFEYGGMCNYQIQYARNRYALPLTRDYIGEGEARLLDK